MDYLETLLAPISDESVCGENLEDDAAFQNFFFTAQGTPERFDGENTIAAEPPDWRAIEKQALEFASRTKDLKLICILAQSLLNTKGIEPFSVCLQALSTLLREQWASVYPLLDEDDNDPLERLASFTHLNVSFVTKTLRNISLVNAKGIGKVTLVEIEKSQSESEDATFSLSQLKGIFKEINLDEVQLFYQSVAYSLESLNDINACLIENAGHQYTADFEKLNAVLNQLKDALERYANVQNAVEEQTQADAGDDAYDDEGNADDIEQNPAQKSSGSSAMNGGEIQSREDVERCLELVNAYYASYEPSSPIPVLVNRAIKLVHKDFLAIVQDIYPDALSAVKNLGGLESDDENDSKDDDDW